jgi:hypothetical protein
MAIGFEPRPVSAGDDADRPDLASVSGARHTEWIPAGIAPTDYQPWHQRPVMMENGISNYRGKFVRWWLWELLWSILGWSYRSGKRSCCNLLWMLLDGVCCEKGEYGLMVELHELENVKSPREKLEILLAVHKVLVDGLSFPSEDGDGHGPCDITDIERRFTFASFNLLVLLLRSLTQYHPSEYRDIVVQHTIHTTIPRRLAVTRRSVILSNKLGPSCLASNKKEAAITFLETVDLPSLNLAPQESDLPTPPQMQRTISSSSTPILKRRAPSLPIDSADPLNALPTDTNKSALDSLAGVLEGSYKFMWNKVQGVVEPPRTLRPQINNPTVLS